MRRDVVTRRHVLGAIAGGGAAMALSSCTGPAPAPTGGASSAGGGPGGSGGTAGGPLTPAFPQQVPASFSEAPALGDLVKAGSLPPVAERLPAVPCVGATDIPAQWLTPGEGVYGGSLRVMSYRQGNIGDDANWASSEPWFHALGLQLDTSLVQPNLMESYEVSPDAKSFTIKMREGMRYSDGSPFTTEDVDFWYKHVLLNTKLTPSFPQDFRAGRKLTGKPMTVKIIDKYNFVVEFDEPYGGFLSRITYGAPKFNCAAYAKKYHADFTPLADLEPLIKDRGFQKGEWWNLYQFMMDVSNQADTKVPAYTPWIVTAMNASNNTAKLERNPYYYKVDPSGKQLPYIDSIDVVNMADPEAGALKIVAGEIDLARAPVQARNMPLYKKYADSKGFRIDLQRQHASLGEIFLNLTSKDATWRKTVGDLRFRQALSLAIDRKAIIDQQYLGLAGEPRIVAVEGYDVDKANQLLDDMGMTKRDGSGMRLGLDGKKFTIRFDIATFTGEEQASAELVSSYWQKVGLDTSIKPVSQELIGQRSIAGETHALSSWLHYPRWPWHEQNDYMGRNSGVQYTYAGEWIQWFETDGKKGAEPPQEYQDLWKMQVDMFASVDPDEQKDLWTKIMANLSANLWWIPIVDDVINPLIVNAKLQNVPSGETAYAIESASAAEIFYYAG